MHIAEMGIKKAIQTLLKRVPKAVLGNLGELAEMLTSEDKLTPFSEPVLVRFDSI